MTSTWQTAVAPAIERPFDRFYMPRPGGRRFPAVQVISTGRKSDAEAQQPGTSIAA
ncbi:MAG: hypothetical protein J2P57_12320 [Acidimicrobiaceae bacterium]|nr:hypothetical protein [Acidimicrobiaceae bacterium]